MRRIAALFEEQEVDGHWIAEVPSLLAYAASESEARAKAQRFWLSGPLPIALRTTRTLIVTRGAGDRLERDKPTLD